MRTLDYDGALLLLLTDEDGSVLAQSAFYKLNLRRYVQSVYSDRLRFKLELNYLDFKKIIALFERDAQKNGTAFTVTEALRQYINSKELHVELRSRLGMEIKRHDAKLQERFSAYRQVVDGAMIRPLRERQMWDSFFMYAMKKTANFSVPGSGKTASVLGVYAFLKQQGTVRRILVICPKNAFGSWIDEFTACFGDKDPLRVFHFHDTGFSSAEQRNAALRYDSGACNLILVNYEAVGSAADILQTLAAQDTLLVFDEVHKVKRIGGQRASEALYVAREANHVIALTGTPLPNAYTDIYNLLHILFPEEYEDFFGFSAAMLRKPNAGEIEQVNDKLQPFFCRTTKRQLGVPEVNPDRIVRNPASATETRLKEILATKYRRNKLALMIRLLQLESDPKALLETLDLRDFAYLLDEDAEIDQIDFADYSDEIQALIERCAEAPTKFRTCVDLAELLASAGKPVIVWCIFLRSIRRLASALEAHGIRCRCIYGEISLEERQEILSDFRNGNVQVLLTNPHTLAESVSLHSVCHDAIYFEYSYNLVHLLQSKDRIHRLGLPEGQYTQYYYLQLEYPGEDGAWSMDAAIYDRLLQKEQTMLDAIDRHILESLPTSEEDLELIFTGL